MTRFADSLVIACPNCERPVLRQRLRSCISFDTVYWSDGYTSTWAPLCLCDLGRCPRCDALFWIEGAEALGTLPDRPMTLGMSRFGRWIFHYADRWEGELEKEKAWLGTPDAWKEADYLETPSGRDLLWSVNHGFADTSDRARYLRVRLWWFGNHPRRGAHCQPPMSSEEEIGNMMVLFDLMAELPSDKRDIVLEAELLREMGRFEQADQVIREAVEGGSDRARIIQEKISQRDAAVCEVGRPSLVIR